MINMHPLFVYVNSQFQLWPLNLDLDMGLFTVVTLAASATHGLLHFLAVSGDVILLH